MTSKDMKQVRTIIHGLETQEKLIDFILNQMNTLEWATQEQEEPLNEFGYHGCAEPYDDITN
jgi:hypothetical protein